MVEGSDTSATQGKCEYRDFTARTVERWRDATMDPEDADDLAMQTEGETL